MGSSKGLKNVAYDFNGSLMPVNLGRNATVSLDVTKGQIIGCRNVTLMTL